jgi:hypothetical protein
LNKDQPVARENEGDVSGCWQAEQRLWRNNTTSRRAETETITSVCFG